MKNEIHSNCRIAPRLFALALAASFTLAAQAQSDQATTPSSAPRDRHDMITSDTTKTESVGKQPDTSPSKLSHADRRFIEKAAHSGLTEVKTAQLAVARAADASIKQFAQQLVTDHMAANKELSDLASKKGVSLADQNRDDRQFKNLSDKSGAEFDSKYLDYATKEHKEDIEMFEKAAQKSDDPDVAAFAAKQLSVLQAHQKTATDIQKTLKR